MSRELKDLSFGGTIGTAFSLVFNNYLYILKYLGIFSGLYVLIMGLILVILTLTGSVSHYADPQIWQNLATDPQSLSLLVSELSSIISFASIPYVLIFYVLYPLVIMEKFNRIYTGETENIPIIETLRLAFKRFIPFSLAMLLMNLGIAGGSILLIVPGIIFSLAWFLTRPIVSLEKIGPVDALRRSWQLTMGSRGEIFGLYFVISLIIGGVYLLVMAGLLIADVGILDTGSMANKLYNYISQFISNGFFSPLQWVLSLVIYYNIRVRKEGFGLKQLTEEFNSEMDPQL